MTSQEICGFDLRPSELHRLQMMQLSKKLQVYNQSTESVRLGNQTVRLLFTSSLLNVSAVFYPFKSGVIDIDFCPECLSPVTKLLSLVR